MGIVVGVWKLSAKCGKVCLSSITHMFDLLMVSMIKEFVTKGVNLPGEGFDDVDIEVLQGQLGDTDTMEKCKVYDRWFW